MNNVAFPDHTSRNLKRERKSGKESFCVENKYINFDHTHAATNLMNGSCSFDNICFYFMRKCPHTHKQTHSHSFSLLFFLHRFDARDICHLLSANICGAFKCCDFFLLLPSICHISTVKSHIHSDDINLRLLFFICAQGIVIFRSFFLCTRPSCIFAAPPT